MDLTLTSRTPWPSLHGASSVDRSVFYREKRASGRAALPPPTVYEGTRFLAYTFFPFFASCRASACFSDSFFSGLL